MKIALAAVWVVLAGCVGCGSPVDAQIRPPPSDVDVRAAYCFESQSRTIALIESSSAERLNDQFLDDPTIGAVARKNKANLAAMRRAKEHLAAYVAGRLLYVDPTMIVLAIGQADRDFDGALKGVPMDAGRTESCNDLSWLPL